MTYDIWTTLNETEREALKLLLPAVDQADIEIRSLLNSNSNFEECLYHYTFMLEQGEFDPRVRPEIDAVRNKEFNEQDIWKVRRK